MRGGFPGGGGGFGNMQSLMRQAQKMQEQMNKAQEELEATEVTGSASGDMVTVTLTGKKQLVAINIKPEVVDPEDVEMLEDLIIAAFNDAMEQVEELESKAMPQGMGGMF